MLSLLRERLGQPELVPEEFRVRSGSAARYDLHAEKPIVKSISAVKTLAKRHVPLLVAKQQIEELMAKRDVAIDVPMLEDPKIFETELQELGIRAVRITSSLAAES